VEQSVTATLDGKTLQGLILNQGLNPAIQSAN
jgi:hypothetical protein